MLRGRPPSEVPSLICRALHAAAVEDGRVTLRADEEAAAPELLAWARPGDAVVLPMHAAEVRDRLDPVLGGGRHES